MNVVDTSSIRGITYISDDHGNDVDSDTEELINNSRLQKLLTMMDRVSNAVHAMMSSVIHSHTIKREQTSSISPSENIDINTNQCSAKLYPEITNVCSGKPKLLTGGVLRDYQLGGVEWILSLFANGLNGILADEMGLGKTLQVIAFLCALQERHSIRGPHLIVMPLSVVTGWESDIKTFCDDSFDVYVHHGEKSHRQDKFLAWKKREVDYVTRRNMNNVQVNKISVVLTTYNMIIADFKIFEKLKSGPVTWQYLVVDEAHRLKRQSSVLFEKLKSIDTRCRLLLTGTPLQNNLSELWSLLTFILPEVFNDMQQFSDWFNRPFEMTDLDDDSESDADTNTDTDTDTDFETEIDIETEQYYELKIDKEIRRQKIMRKKKQIEKKKKKSNAKPSGPDFSTTEKNVIISSLHRILKPFILRRLKSEVAIEVPPKYERIVMCPQSSLQIKVHEIIKTILDNQEDQKTAGKSRRGSMLRKLETPNWIDGSSLQTFGGNLNLQNTVMQLRKLCNHPYLLLEDISSIPDDLYYEFITASSGKLCMLDRLLKVLLSNGHKVLIFSQMTTMLDVIQGHLYTMGVNCLRLDGGTSREERIDQMNSFKKSRHTDKSAEERKISSDDDYPVFLLSTRAGGVGINLQSADTVILFDSDWNPQQDLQAMSRAHRLGQTKEVLVLRLVSNGINSKTYDGISGTRCVKLPSIEERILKRANHKLDTERMILAEGHFDMGTGIGVTASLSNKSKQLNDILQIDGKLVNLFKGEDGIPPVDANEYRPAMDLLSAENILAALMRPSSISTTTDALKSAYNLLGSEDSIDFMISEQSLEKWMPWIEIMTGSTSNTSNFSSRCNSYQNVSAINVDKEIIASYQSDPNMQLKLVRPKRQRLLTSSSNEALCDEYSDEWVDLCDSEDMYEENRKRNHRKRASSKFKSPKTTAKSLKSAPDSGADKCQFCKKLWLSKLDVTMLRKVLVFQSVSSPTAAKDEISDDIFVYRDTSDDCISLSSPGPSISCEHVRNLRDLMIVCDSCDGTFHVLCMGLLEIPDGDWFCRWCEENQAM